MIQFPAGRPCHFSKSFFLAVIASLVIVFSTAPAQAATIVVPPGGDLQAAINTAQPGDTILLAAGASFIGSFQLPNKSGSDWITIRTSAADSLLPPAGSRISPSYSNVMPKIVSHGFGEAALYTEVAAHHYRFIGVEFMRTSPAAVVYDLVQLGDSTAAQDSLAEVPHDLEFDRCYIHGDSGELKRGVALNSSSTSIHDCYISDFHVRGQDTQAIGGWNGPGDYHIINNYLEGAGENILFGGATGGLTAAGMVITGIEIRRNYFYKPPAWRSVWTVKNLLEFKNAQNVIVDGNVFENNWLDGQQGYAILFTPRPNDSGPGAVVQDVTFTNNIVRHVAAALHIMGQDSLYTADPTSHRAKRIRVANNLFDDVNGPAYAGDGCFVKVGAGTENVTIEHNTVFQSGNLAKAWGDPSTGSIFRNNIARYNEYGFFGDSVGYGNPALGTYFPGADFRGNVIALEVNAPWNVTGVYPAGNFFPATMAAVGFIDLNGGDYTLRPDSVYKGAATDGTDPGCDFAALNAAVAGSPTPTPTPTPSPLPTPPPTGDVVWVDDSLPAGATPIGDGEQWNWVSGNPGPYSGALANQSALVAGFHQHYFYGATATLAVNAGDVLSTYIFIDQNNVPSEIMLQWSDGGWDHRAYWGSNNIGWGTDGTDSRRFMGALPPAGQWVRLEVPASQVGLEGKTISGMAFALHDGSATWDRAGKSSQAAPSPSPTPTPTPAPTSTTTHALLATPANVIVGGAITVGWAAPAGHSSTDWVGLFREGDYYFSFIDWQPTGNSSSGFMSFTAPDQPGRYEFRYFPDNGYTSVITSEPVNITLNPTGNPIDDARHFVRQHYLDFLGREPDLGGWDYWTQQITSCPVWDAACVQSRRINVTAAFFVELEFQETGSFVYRFYKLSLGRTPSFAEFLPDRAQVVAGPNLEANKQSLANAWVQRTEFLQKYPAGLTGTQFIDRLLQTAQQSSGADISSLRSELIDDWNNFQSRARIVRMVADMPAFVQAEYNPSFVLMQYFGYLRRDPDPGGYTFWLDVLNNRVPNNHRGMVCAFITSAEYQLRFGTLVTRTNGDCGP